MQANPLPVHLPVDAVGRDGGKGKPEGVLAVFKTVNASPGRSGALNLQRLIIT